MHRFLAGAACLLIVASAPSVDPHVPPPPPAVLPRRSTPTSGFN
jgi:hypothetical protein